MGFKKIMKRKLVGQNDKKNIRKNFGRYFLFLVAGILSVSSVLMTLEVATSGTEVAGLRRKEAELSLEKRNLENILAKSDSIGDLEERSNEIGYSRPADIIYITGSKETAAILP